MKLFHSQQELITSFVLYEKIFICLLQIFLHTILFYLLQHSILFPYINQAH